LLFRKKFHYLERAILLHQQPTYNNLILNRLNMDPLNLVMQRFDSHQNNAYAYIRIFLGLALFVRACLLIVDPGTIVALASDEKLHVWFAYITIAHLIGGLSLTLGLYTRLGALLQIPILTSAVFIVHAKAGLMMGGQSLELAALVLFLLIVYFVYGSGPLALDSYFNKKK